MKTKKSTKSLYYSLCSYACRCLQFLYLLHQKSIKKTATVYVNKIITLKIDGAKRKPKWKSSNTKIATVNKNGVVRGKKAGKVKITGYLTAPHR